MVSQILQYGAGLKSAYMRIKISSNCSDDQISYENPFNNTVYVNASAPADKSCHIFSSAGGSVAPLMPNILDAAQVSVRSDQWQFLITESTGGFGTTTDDLIAYGKIGSQTLCNSINLKASGVTSVPTIGIAILATGNFPHTVWNADFGSLKGQLVGCFYTNHIWSRGYWFYQVLEVR